MHDRAGFHWDDGFGSRRPIAQCTVWSLGVVVFPPLLDQDLSLTQAIEDIPIEQFIPHPPVEAFAVPILPGRTWHDECRLCTDSRDPIPNRLPASSKAPLTRPDNVSIAAEVVSILVSGCFRNLTQEETQVPANLKVFVRV